MMIRMNLFNRYGSGTAERQALRSNEPGESSGDFDSRDQLQYLFGAKRFFQPGLPGLLQERGDTG